MVELFLCIAVVILYILSKQGGNAEEIVDPEARRRRLFVNPYGAKLCAGFENLANTLAPSKNYIQEVQIVAHVICEYLQVMSSSHKFQIDRWVIAGSIGKQTAIWHTDRNQKRLNTGKPDLDLVLILNNVEESPFITELQSFAELLGRLNVVSIIKIWKYSVEFKFWTESQGDLKVDLLVAKNHSQNIPFEQDKGELEAQVTMTEVTKKQQRSILETLNVDEKENKRISTQLAEKTVKVIREYVKDNDVLSVVRLAKLWNSLIDMSQFDYVPARSCIIVIIAIHTMQNVLRQNCPRDIVSDFRRFLENVSQFRKLNISLDCLECIPSIPNCITPMIRDPVNGWNNLAAGLQPEAMEIWENQAKMTLKMLEDYRNSEENSKYPVENVIDAIFSPKENNPSSVVINIP